MRITDGNFCDRFLKIKVVGIGGGGCNTINHIAGKNLASVEFIAVDTDSKTLEHCRARTRVRIGENVTKGLSAGANIETGRAAVEESRGILRDTLRGADMVFIAAGMGGGTGTGGAPVVAEIARELGILTVAAVTRPFVFEGRVREKNAKIGIEILRKCTDSLFIIQNQKLLSILDMDAPLTGAFEAADGMLYQLIKSISEITANSGLIAVDFEDIKAVIQGKGEAFMGVGYDENGSRALTAFENAMRSPLLDGVSMNGARGLLINITSGEDLDMCEVGEVCEAVLNMTKDMSAMNIITGIVIEPDMNGKRKVAVIVTGFNAPYDNRENEPLKRMA